MRTFLLLLLLLMNSAVFCQADDTINNSDNTQQIDDSITALLQKMNDSLINRLSLSDKVAVGQDRDTVLDYLNRVEGENTDKEKKVTIVKIILGLALLGILIIGLIRKVKK